MNISRIKRHNLPPIISQSIKSKYGRRFFDTHTRKLEMLSPQDLRLTFPEESKHLNEQHFYQVSIKKWLERPPRPLTLAQMAQFGRHMSKQKVIRSANHVAEELTIRFAHRIRQMQLMPYRLMGHPALLDTYEQYVDSFEMLRRIGQIETLDDNDKLVEIGQKLLEKHTLVVTNVIRGVRQIINARHHKEEDVRLLDSLVRSLLSSRLSRRVLVKQHHGLTRAWQNWNSNNTEDQMVGEVKLNCKVVDALQVVEKRAKQNLARVFNIDVSQMPQIVLEGDPQDTRATFPYLWPHFEFVFGELIYNSLEALLRLGSHDPVVVTVSATTDSVMVRISDHGGGISEEEQQHLWLFTKPDLEVPITPRALADHQFFSLLFPAEELGRPAEEELPKKAEHFGLGLALSKLYVEYWGGALELHSLDGFGCDALLRISRKGSKHENLHLDG